ncbi:alpha/beta hydrolase [Brevundimonas staleyi]|uniref:Alpha/beta hydrolase n=1 Tax=Brevundimonas staleyi TaxID=74326 RepID=A0ABW0FV23_9CAUL
MLDPQSRALLADLNAMTRQMDIRGADDLAVAARAQAAAIFKAFAGTSPDEDGVRATAITVQGGDGDRPARLYRSETPAQAAPALVVFFHGGGWAVGDLDCYDGMMRALCRLSGAVFLSLDYRLAPEHGFPAGLEDALAATRWAARAAADLGCDPDRLMVMGDSAGGNLAAVVAHQARESGPRLAAQYLLYPVIDASRPHEAYPSRMAHGDGDLFLSRDAISGTLAWYLAAGGTEPGDPRVSPINARNLSGLAPAYVLVADHDPLRDEGLAYARRLSAAGTPVTTAVIEGTIHGFLTFGDLDVCHAARRRIADDIRLRQGSPAG